MISKSLKIAGASLFLLSLISIFIIFSLRWINPSTSHFIWLYEQSSGREIQTVWVNIDELPWHLPASIIASEDQRFPSHKGFDWRQIHIAVKDKMNGKRLRGASTLSQQTIKNLFLWPAKSLFRKSVEGWFTVWLEILVPKKRILEIYLNIAQFSKTSFGVENAAKQYFGVKANRLSIDQSSHLAICLPSPARCRPNNPSEHASKKAEWIKTSIRKLGGKRMIDRL